LPSQLDGRLGLGRGAGGPPAVITVPRGGAATFWDLDPDAEIGTSRAGHRVKLRPFMGIMGMPLDVPGAQSTFPPTACGGNLDCRELVQGTVLLLPIAVDGGLFSVGDGHAAQGDGEVAGPALNCPMEVGIGFHLRPGQALSMPRARTSEGWIAFGFHRDLDEACAAATLEMLKLMSEQYGFTAKEALSLASLVVNLRVTQMVNGVRGVHAILPHGAIEVSGEAG
jgi:acetamidase/formamidase